MRRLGTIITAAATTGPNSDPRPASSSPAIRCQPHLRASRSNRDEHCLAIAADFSTVRRNSVQTARAQVTLPCKTYLPQLGPPKESHENKKPGRKSPELSNSEFVMLRLMIFLLPAPSLEIQHVPRAASERPCPCVRADNTASRGARALGATPRSS